MLDTVILQIPRGNYIIVNHEKFKPTTRGMLDSPYPYSKYVNNPTKQDKDRGLYKPKLTIFKRGRNFPLKIEFSVPKLIYGNNLDEVNPSDFEKVCDILQARIADMGVKIFKRHIETAEVLSFHPSKNIPITNGYTASFVIRELYKTDVSKKFDIEKIAYRNNGEALQIYTNSHSFVVYDKINDLTKPAKRAIDKEQTSQQATLYDYIKTNRKHLEIIRFEVRLSRKAKMNQVLKRIGQNSDPTFKDVMNKALCKKIVNTYWNDFFADSLFIFSLSDNPQKILNTVLTKQPNIKLLNALKLTGIMLLSKDDEGLKGFRQIVEKHQPNVNWYVAKRDIKALQAAMFGTIKHSFVQDIKKNLKSFAAYKSGLLQVISI